MFFLSTLRNAPVFDSSFAVVGKYKDIIASLVPDQYAPVKGLVVTPLKGGGERVIPWSAVENASRVGIHLSTLVARVAPVQENGSDIRLREKVLDHQIVDITGVRVVRVNDLQLGTIEGRMCVIAIDVSAKALLRRLDLDRLDVFNLIPVKLIDWRQANLVAGSVQIMALSKDVVHIHPADIATIVEDLNVKQGSELMKSLDLATAARVFEEIDPETRRILVKALSPDKVALITDKMPLDEVVDLLKSLPAATSDELLSYFQSSRAASAERLIHYSNHSAGGLMTTEFIKCGLSCTVAEIIEEIKKFSPAFRFIHYVYVVDEENRFMGVASFRRLITSAPNQTIQEIMRDRKGLKILRPEQSLREVAVIMAKYKLFSAAVVDKRRQLLGVITMDDVMRQLVMHRYDV
ncbi:MAG: CBS domain-containing protein [Patescibacteria group bacterium]